MKKVFELVNVDTDEALNLSQEKTEEEANKNNEGFRVTGQPYRWIEQRPRPADNCGCGALFELECVCNFDDDE